MPCWPPAPTRVRCATRPCWATDSFRRPCTAGAVLATYLERRSQHDTDVKLFPSPTALVEALRAGQVDVAVPNLRAYLQTRRWPERMVTLPVPDVPPAQADRYRAVLLARTGVSSDTLRRDAAQLRLVLVGRDSASGGFVPASHLRQLGLDPDSSFASVRYAGSRAAALSDGEADVAALAADVYDTGAATGLVELWRSEPIPPGPLLCRPAADVPCQAIATWLLEAHVTDPSVLAALRAGWPEFGDARAFVPASGAALEMRLPVD